MSRAADLETQPPDARWLARDFWSRAAVGLIGGAPKSCKSWLGLDLALSVTSETPCLGRFAIEAPGPALIYLAEDALPCVRARLDALCCSRGISLRKLDLHVVTAPVLRLDLEEDQERLQTTLEQLRPRLLLLDPLVRMHRLDENSAKDVSGLLGFLRGLQRAFDLAIVVVHHASKRYRGVPGQGLRGSSDLYAFGDSNAYIAKHDDLLKLTIEHRAAAAPDPLFLKLVSALDGAATHLQILDGRQGPEAPVRNFNDLVLEHLRTASAPVTRTTLRQRLAVNNSRLGDALKTLERSHLAVHTDEGWLACGPNQQQLPLAI